MAITYPVKLKLFLDKANLSNIESSIKNKLGDQGVGAAGAAAGGATEVAQDGVNEQKRSNKTLGNIAIAVGVLGAIAGFLSGLEPVTFLLSSLLGLINALLSPILLLMLVLFKPFLLLFLAVGRWMFRFFKDPVGALKGLWDGFKSLIPKTLFGMGEGGEVEPLKASEIFKFAPIGIGVGALIGDTIARWALQFGQMLGDALGTVVGVFYDFGASMGSRLADFIIWIADQLQTIWNWTFDFGSWVWQQVTSIWNYVQDFGTWLWENLKSVFIWDYDFSGWLWSMLQTIWNWGFDLGTWLWDSITGALSTGLNILSNIGSWISRQVKSFFSFGGDRSQKAFGGTVAREGSYYLHKGETVVPARQSARNMGGGSPTINITIQGNATRGDADAIAKSVLQKLKRYGAY